MKAKCRKWTQDEVDLLVRYWRNNKALGKNDKTIISELVSKLGRKFGSIFGKVTQLKLTRASALVAHEYQRSSLGHSYQQLKHWQRQSTT